MLAEFGKGPFFPTPTEAWPWLLLFAHRYRTGVVAPHGQPVKSRTVEDALRLVAQAHCMAGYPDIRKPDGVTIDYRLQQLLRGYARKDPPPFRVKPIPVSVLHCASAICDSRNTDKSRCLRDVMWMAFFFLMRPGEYTKPSSQDAAPFRFCDVHLHIGDRRLNLYEAPASELLCATLVTLTFTTQKNANRGEVVGHGPNDHLVANPVRAVARRLAHLRQHGADLTELLCAYWSGATFRYVTSADLTALLRQAAAVDAAANVPPDEVSARSLRASGAMALLHQKVDGDVIRLLGRWKTDEMFRYLHLQSQPLMQAYSSTMLRGGDYSLLPNDDPLVPLH